MLRRAAWVPVLFTLLSGCSSGDEEVTKEGAIRADETWSGNVRLLSTVTIYAGATVTIEPGTTVSCSANTSIIVEGGLKKSGGTRAKIACASWIGIIVAKGGRIDVEGIEVENADTALEVTKEVAEAKVKDATLTGATPFTVLAGSTLTLTQVKATAKPHPTQQGSKIFGSLVASRLEYFADVNEGLWIDEGGEAVVEDSILRGKNGLDLVSARKGKSLVLRYSTLEGAHCGPHLEGISSFEIDHVTSMQNVFGITIYGADKGTLRDSNLAGLTAWIDLQGDHGPLTIENVFTEGSEVIENTAPPTIVKAASRIPDAKPR
jgi:hypothetical protein